MRVIGIGTYMVSFIGIMGPEVVQVTGGFIIRRLNEKDEL
jgi:hypothetical protein